MCGKKLRKVPRSTSAGSQIKIYLISILFPPFGLVPGFIYLFQKGIKAKIIGLTAILLTIGITVFGILLATKSLEYLNMQVQQQLAPYESLGF